MKKAISLVSCAVLIYLLAVGAFGESLGHNFTAEINKTAVAMGETLKLTLSYSGDGDIGAFLVSVNYDSTFVSFVKAEKEAAAINNYMEYNDTVGSTTAVYTSKDKNKLGGQVITFYYKISENINAEAVNFNVVVSDLVDTDATEISGTTEIIKDVIISQAPSDTSTLLELIPSYGKLNEEFSPTRTDYTMTVPYSIKQIIFETTGAEGSVVAVNRKNLGSGGSTNKFIITVTAADRLSKTQYVVMVTRGNYRQESIADTEKPERPALLSVVPSDGELNEEFSPDIYEYTMTVPYEVSSLEFKTSASEGADVKVSRKRLGSGGSVTDFLLTVTVPGYDEKVIYKIAVTRGEYVRSSIGSDSGGTAANNRLKNGAVDNTAQGDGESDYVLEKYTQTAPIVVKQDSFSAFALGAAISIISVAVGAITLLIIVRGINRKNKHDEKNK